MDSFHLFPHLSIKRMCQGTFSHRTRSPATYFCFAQVCILTERFLFHMIQFSIETKKPRNVKYFYFHISGLIISILIIVNIFYTSFLDDFSPSFAIAVYIRHIHHPGECIWKLPGTAVFIYVFSSFIQTIRSVLELHQIMRHALADFTAGRELHPALKISLFCYHSLSVLHYRSRGSVCQSTIFIIY